MADYLDVVAALRLVQLFSVFELCVPAIKRHVSTSWWLGVVAGVVRRMNEVTLRRARLVLGWVTVFGRVYHHGM